jgi:hypothetical protein
MANHHLITNIVDMRATLAFSCFIVLHDQAPLPVGNIVPVGFKGLVVEHVTAKHKL